MSPITALILELALAVTTALVAPVRPLGVAGALGILAVPFFVRTDQPIIVLYLATYASIVAMRGWDLVRRAEPLSVVQRLWHVHSFFDTRLVKTRERGFDAGVLGAAMGWFTITGIALAAGLYASHALSGPLRFAIRWVGCAVVFLTMFEAMTRLFQVAYGPLGLRPPPVHDSAWASRSLREFWGVRWNKAAAGWLREHFFEPLRTRDLPGAGVVATFVASAALHCYLVLPSLGAFWAGVMSLFFVLQIALVAVERALGVPRWSPAAARVWTMGMLLVASPLFCEPVFRIFDPLLALLPRA